MNTLRAVYEDSLVKTAKLRMSDVEDRLGFYLDDDKETEVRKGISDATAKSFAIRHPWLTGIPTLGIAPSIAKGRAADKIVRGLARKHGDIRSKIDELDNKNHARAMDYSKAQSDSDRANAGPRAVAAAMSGFRDSTSK